MGSGSSSNVKPISTASLNTTTPTEPSGDVGSSTGESGPITRGTPSKKTRKDPLPTVTQVHVFPGSSENGQKSGIAEIPSTAIETMDLSKNNTGTSFEYIKENIRLKEEITALQKQVGDLESHSLDLSEQIQILEEQLEARHADEVAKSTEPCVNTVAAKDQCIQKLEKETKNVQDEIAKLKLKYKKKIRSMNSQITEAKHESSLAAFEMKDEVQRLRDENAALMEKIKSLGSSKAAGQTAKVDNSCAEDEVSSGRTGLILELSSRVSEQESKIVELELKLKERDRTIEELKKTKRTGSSKARRTGSAKSQNSIDQNLDQDDFSINDDHSVLENGTDEQYLPGSHPRHNDMDARRRTKKKNCLRDRARGSQAGGSNRNQADARESSGMSRDSGFDSVHGDSTAIASSPWLRSRPKNQAGGNGHEDTDDGLEVESVLGPTPGPSGYQQAGGRGFGRPGSPESQVSKWSDEEGGEQDFSDVKSTISQQSSIRRISAPKKKKKHAVFNHDAMMANLLNDLDGPLDVSSLSTLKSTDSINRPKVSVSGH